MQTYSGEDFVNVGIGDDVTIRELAELIKNVTGFKGEIVQDLTKPDGTPRKLMDVARLSGLGWKAKTSLEEGVAGTYEWFLQQGAALRL
jgi:GDP-L-fucose synthase